MAMMAAVGEIEAPDAAIFADTGSEPGPVYDWLDWLEGQLTFPVYRVSAGSVIGEDVVAPGGHRRETPPFFTINEEGSRGQLAQKCTRHYKARAIDRAAKAMAGLRPGARLPSEPVVEQWKGFTTDEITRAKPSTEPWRVFRWPLLELRMSRPDCIEWFRRRGAHPPKSACKLCPYRSNAGWRWMRDNAPEDFREAIEIDRAIRPGFQGTNARACFVHPDRVPLEEVDLSTAEDRGQWDAFTEECEGLCGL
jgi:hypothetical protein